MMIGVLLMIAPTTIHSENAIPIPPGVTETRVVVVQPAQLVEERFSWQDWVRDRVSDFDSLMLRHLGHEWRIRYVRFRGLEQTGVHSRPALGAP